MFEEGGQVNGCQPVSGHIFGGIKEHLQTLNRCVLDLEHEPGDLHILDEIFRSAHTIKGDVGNDGVYGHCRIDA